MADLAHEPASGAPGAARETVHLTASAPPAEAGRLRLRPWQLRLSEAVVSVVAALGYTALCRHISVNPLNRIGQVSGLATLQEYVALIGLPLLAVLLYAAYRGTLRQYELAKRLVCAALAGLATGVVAGGVVVALRGTPWPLGGQEGDPSVLIDMATSIMHGKGIGVYPPAFPAAMAAWSEMRYGGVGGAGYALHDLQIICSALVGPMSYLAWRLLLRPFWALLIAVPAAVVFLDPIRPYSHVVMIMLLPLLAAFMRELRRTERRSVRSALLLGVGFGVVFGLMFLWYSGWYLWSAPGVFVLALLLFPWRKGRAAITSAAAFVVSAGVAFAVVGAPLIYEIVRLGASTPDRYAYLSVYADPTYVLGWMSDRSGQLTYDTWPAAGELGPDRVRGAAAAGRRPRDGSGAAEHRGADRRGRAGRRLADALLLRREHGAHPADPALPRTTWIIMYCLMILAVLGLMALVQRGTGWLDRALRAKDSAVGVISPRVLGQLSAGMVCAVALFATMGASWSINRYMPESSETSMGIDAYRAQEVKKADGTCPKYSPVTKCADHIVKDWKPTPDTGLWCSGIPTEDWPAVCGRPAPWVTGTKN